MAGEVASLLLSRMAVPILYYMANRHESAEPVPSSAPMEVTSAIEPSSQESCFGAGSEPVVLRMRA